MIGDIYMHYQGLTFGPYRPEEIVKAAEFRARVLCTSVSRIEFRTVTAAPELPALRGKAPAAYASSI